MKQPQVWCGGEEDCIGTFLLPSSDRTEEPPPLLLRTGLWGAEEN